MTGTKCAKAQSVQGCHKALQACLAAAGYFRTKSVGLSLMTDIWENVGYTRLIAHNPGG